MSRAGSRTRGRILGMRRWDGRSRITTDWFNYHQDPELSFSDGDILVFLHGPESSGRGASFRLHAEYIATTGFESLVNQCVSAPIPTHWALPAGRNGQLGATVKELYLPAPKDADKATVARHHLATRNFFAWLYDRPLTGKTLGASLVDVLSRAHTYRPNDAEANNKEMLAYLDRRGYTDFRECVDHALAALYLAENFQMEALWVNAFAHCVGMNHSLHASTEFDAISRVTKAVMTRTRLEMDVRLDRVAKSLKTFFDNEISGSYLGLTPTARDHMDRFRSHLHAYHIESHGFWPPAGFDSSFALRRSLYRSMYVEFRALYEHLVDPESKPSLQHNRPMEGGICTLQNVRAFDSRYRLETLPHPLPLLPSPPQLSPSVTFTMRKRRTERDARHAALTKSLIEASNRDMSLTNTPLVRRYNQFERQTILDDIDPVNLIEGRKVRWILVYAVFQILASVISAPKEVVDTEGLSYPLCCQRPKTMPWMMLDIAASTVPVSFASRSIKRGDVVDDLHDQKPELRPDVDYITSQRNHSSTSLTNSLSTTDSRSASSVPKSPSATITSKSSSGRSLLRLLQRRKTTSAGTATISKPALSARPKHASFHEILVYGYGNGLNETIDDTPKTPINDGNNNHSDQQSVCKTTLKRNSLVDTATSHPTKHDPASSLLNSHPLSRAPQKSTAPPPAPLPSTTLDPPSRPDSPTVPTLPPSPSISRESSLNSEISRTTSSTSNTSNFTDAEEPDHTSVKSADTATATATAPAPTPIPTPKPPELLNITARTARSTSAPWETESLDATPRPQGSSALDSVAGPEDHLDLPSSTGPRGMGMPSVFLKS